MMYGQCFHQVLSKTTRFQILIHPRWVQKFSHSWYHRNLSKGHCMREDKTLITLQNVFSDTNRERVKQLLPATKTPLCPDNLKEVKSEAAVLIPLCMVDGEPSMLLMKRSVYIYSHSGEICFPGGMKDETDTDLIETAFRETYEEIGLCKDQVEVWGQMTPYFSRTAGNWVTPVVALCGSIDLKKLDIDTCEVAKVFTVTIKSLCTPANQRQTQWRYPGSPGFTFPVFLIGEYRIWGLTAIFLHMLLPLLSPDLYKLELNHRR